MLTGETLIVAAIGVVFALLAARFMRDSGWDMVVPLAASGVIATILAFRDFEILPNEDVANGILLFLGIYLSVFYLLMLAVIVPVTVWLARKRWPGEPDAD